MACADGEKIHKLKSNAKIDENFFMNVFYGIKISSLNEAASYYISSFNTQ